MSQNMVAPNAYQNFSTSDNTKYSSDANKLVSAVADAHVSEMLKMGCVPQIVAADIAAGAVGTSQLAAGATTEPKIAAGAVGSTELAAASVGTTKLAGGFAKHAEIAGGAAGDHTVAGIAVGDELDEVLHLVGAATSQTNTTDITSEFTISGANTINNTGGTDTSAGKLMVRWTKKT